MATTHDIGARQQAASGLPWVAEFHDPMIQECYSADLMIWRQFEAIERGASRQAALCTFTTPCALARYPVAAARMQLLENGYDEPDGLLASELAVAGASREGRASAFAHWLEHCVAKASQPAGAAA